MGACAKSKSIDPSIYFTVLEVGYGITVPYPGMVRVSRSCRHSTVSALAPCSPAELLTAVQLDVGALDTRDAANNALQPNALPARGAQRPLGDAVRSSCRAALLRALARVEIEVETRGATRARARGCGKRLRGALGLACHTHLRNSSALGLCQTPTTTNPVSPNCDARPRIETHELTAQRS
jgi:hypothetical protein